MRQAAVSSYVKFEDYFEREASESADAPRHEWFDGVVLCCASWNVTVSPPWYVPGCQETDVEFHAFPPPLHHRAEGRDSQAPHGRQGPCVGPVQRARAPAQRVLPMAAAGPREPCRRILDTGGRWSQQAREGARSQDQGAGGQARQEGPRDRRGHR